MNKGDTVYSQHGHEYEYVSFIEDRHCVRPILLNDDDSEPYYGDPLFLKQVFTSPPYEKRDEKINELDKLIAEKSTELYKLNKELAEFQKNHKQRMEYFKKFKALKNIEDVLEGRITHLVKISGWDVQVLEFNDIVEMETRYTQGAIKLISLFGKSNGDLEYRLHDYTDGSGSSCRIIPCTSLEEANEEAWHFIQHKLDINFNINRIHMVNNYMGIVKKIGKEIPKDMLKLYYEDKLTRQNEFLNKEINEINQLNQNIQELQQKLNDLGE